MKTRSIFIKPVRIFVDDNGIEKKIKDIRKYDKFTIIATDDPYIVHGKWYKAMGSPYQAMTDYGDLVWTIEVEETETP